MAFTDPVGDMATRIRNACKRKKTSVEVPFSTLKAKILDVLLKEGYIEGYEQTGERISQKNLVVRLKYGRDRSVIRTIDRVSKPSLHIHRKASQRRLVANGLGIEILSTSSGVVSDERAKELGIGGKALLSVS